MSAANPAPLRDPRLNPQPGDVLRDENFVYTVTDVKQREIRYDLEIRPDIEMDPDKAYRSLNSGPMLCHLTPQKWRKMALRLTPIRIAEAGNEK